MYSIQTNKERYRLYCDEQKNIPLFMQAWWMDAVCENKYWDVLFYEKKDKIIAVWVYHFIKKLGFKIILQPQLTQTNGIWMERPDNISKNEMISFENEVMKNLLQQFQQLKFSYYEQNFPLSFTNWLPFYWKGYQQTTRYTYQLIDISDPEKCLKSFHTSKKTHINNAQKSLSIKFDLSSDEFYNHLQENFKALGQKVFYSKELFDRLYSSCKSRNQGCVISAHDQQNQLHAALYIVWDQNSAYDLISTINPQFRRSGASSLVVYEAIKHMSDKSKVFDFEGSMSKNIEKSFREFGSIQVPYFRIFKYNSYLFQLLFQLKKWRK